MCLRVTAAANPPKLASCDACDVLDAADDPSEANEEMGIVFDEKDTIGEVIVPPSEVNDLLELPQQPPVEPESDVEAEPAAAEPADEEGEDVEWDDEGGELFLDERGDLDGDCSSCFQRRPRCVIDGCQKEGAWYWRMQVAEC